MKILHLLTSINTGGAEKFCVDLCNTQATVFNDKIYLCVLDNLSGDKPLVKQIHKNVNLISLNKEGGYSLKIIFKLYKLFKDIMPDCIHINGRALVYSSLPILLLRIPSVYTVHTFANKEYNRYIRAYNRCLFRCFDKLFVPVAISNTVLKTIKNTYGNEYETLIYNGSSEIQTTPLLNDVSKFIQTLIQNDETMLFVSIGRISPEKNTLLLIETFNKLLDLNYNVALCIIGYDSNKDKTYIEKCKKANKNPNSIKFLGRKENIADYLYFADANCMTSNYEGLGITALESFSMGVPVLSTPSGGPSDIIISGVNGYVSECISVASYLNIIKIFIKKPIINKDTIRKIYKKKYSMKECAQQYLLLYRKRLK